MGDFLYAFTAAQTGADGAGKRCGEEVVYLRSSIPPYLSGKKFCENEG